MAFAVIDVIRTRGTTSCFTLSGPQDLVDRIQAAMKHSGVNGRWSGERCDTEVPQATLLNWVEASGWKLDQYSLAMIENGVKMHSYVFHKI
jgi:hypothetical protein